MTPSKEEISSYFRDLQDIICSEIANTDGKQFFREDIWQRQEGGGGRSRTIANGRIIEKGGVGFSEVWGDLHPKMLQSMGIEQQTQFYATGVSVVLHPISPMMPIIHMNVRYFEMTNGECWFGGGIDLTPHYIDTQDARWFHQQLKDACDKHDVSYYPKFKNGADDYFYSPHRNETRGIGGIFFDYQKPNLEKTKQSIFELVKQVGESFAPIYTHFMKKNSVVSYGENEKKWQNLRRGRYVEFNLVHDRGTKFGLETNGRTESILMSMPPVANWEYDYKPEIGSPEANTLAMLIKGFDWLA
jgi:coproporphyrinogen III oxidase